MGNKITAKRKYLFIDGTNLYAGQFDLFGPDKYLEFSKFIKKIEEELDLKFDKVYFYASYSHQSQKSTKIEKMYLKNEGLFYRNVKNVKNLIFFTGYRSKTSGKEKEVDVKLAVDVVDFVHKNDYDEIYLMSGDADFMHSLKIAERLKKNVFILALENRIPIRLTFNYKTYVFVFNRKSFSRKFSKIQKVKVIFIEDKLSEAIIK